MGVPKVYRLFLVLASPSARTFSIRSSTLIPSDGASVLAKLMMDSHRALSFSRIASFFMSWTTFLAFRSAWGMGRHFFRAEYGCIGDAFLGEVRMAGISDMAGKGGVERNEQLECKSSDPR